MISWKKVIPVLKKATAVNSQPNNETFPELPTVLLWVRFVIAIAYGTLLGWYNVRSPTLPLQGLNLITFLPVLYAKFYLGVNDQERDEAKSYGMSLVFSGTLNAVAAFLLVWICFYTAANSESEGQLIELLLKTYVAPHDSVVNNDSIDVDNSNEQIQLEGEAGVPPEQESEF